MTTTRRAALGAAALLFSMGFVHGYFTRLKRIFLPNYLAFWRHVAAVTPRYASRAEEAAADLVGWRQWLESMPRSAVEEGPPFPATSDSIYELYIVDQPAAGLPGAARRP